MFKYFVYEDVEPQLIDSMAQVLRESQWDMRPLLRMILTSQAFYSDKAIGTQIKSPIQLVVGSARILGIDAPDRRALGSALNQMGQVPLEPPNVKGWPGGRMWINTSTLFVRYNTAITLASGRGFNPPTSRSSPEQVVDEWVMRLIQRPVSIEKKKVLIEALEDRPDNAAAVKKMVQLIVSMPEYQLC